MAVVLFVLGLSLLMQSCVCASKQYVGCRQWNLSGDDFCCVTCHKGNRLVKACGPSSKELCKPCDRGTFLKSGSDDCVKCSECVGGQIILKNCTITSDTQCGCKEGMHCGDERCSFCVDKCKKGHQPAVNGSCEPCPEGTFNNLTHSECKPWSTKCPKLGQNMVEKGDAFNDIKCEDSVPVQKFNRLDVTGSKEDLWMVVLIITAIIVIILILIIAVLMRLLKKQKTFQVSQDAKEPEFFIYTDEPKTLIAVECSFHESEEEQGTSSDFMGFSGKLIR